MNRLRGVWTLPSVHLLLAGFLTLGMWEATAAPARAQHRILYLDPNMEGAVVEVSGAILDETKVSITVKPLTADKIEIPAKAVVDIIYAPGKADVAEEYKKAYEAEQTAARMFNIDRRKALEGVIDLYRSLLPKLANEKNIQRHVQFRIAALTAIVAAGDKVKTMAAIDLLEQYRKEHPDSWQIVHCERQLMQLKGKK